MADLIRADAGAAADAPAEHDVDWRQVRAILAARWRIGAKRLRGRPWRILLAVVGSAVFGAVVAALTLGAFALVAALRSDPSRAPAASAAVHAAFLGVAAWIVASPALGLRGGEFLDVTKLFTFPVNHRTVLVATLLGLATSRSVLLLALPLCGAVAGWGGGPAAVAGGLAAAVATVLVAVALGHALLLLFLGVFRSRRWRDATSVALALASAGLFAAMRLASREWAQAFEGGLARFGEVKDVLLPLPTWWAAHAVTGAGWTRWLPALGLPVMLFWLVRAAAVLQERVHFGEIEEPQRVAPGPRGGFAGWVARRFRGVLAGLVEKDVRVLLRDPTVRLQVVQQAGYAVVPVVAAFVRGGGGLGEARAAAWVYPGLACFPALAAVSLALNPLGTEGAGIQHAFLTPAPRPSVLLSKTIAMLAVLGTGAAIVAAGGTALFAALAAAAPAPEVLLRAGLAALEAWAALAVVCGVGSVVGAAWPHPVVTRERRALRQASVRSRGCLAALGGFAAMLAAAALAIPVVLAFHHPAIAAAFGRTSASLLWVTAPLGLGWAALVAWGGSRAGGALLAPREEETLAALARAEG